MLFKYCGKCKKLKPVSEFNKGGYDGYDCYCKECRSIIRQIYYKKRCKGITTVKLGHIEVKEFKK